MEKITSGLRIPAIASTLLVLPFLILELVNRRAYQEGFPFPLFLFLWILPLAFIVTLTSILRDLRERESLAISPMMLLLRSGILLFLAWLWVSVLVDQMPCFLGVPNCD
jgi:hypothetical protein